MLSALAANTGCTIGTCTVANTAIGDIARASGARLWFQLYAQKDHGFTRELIGRAEAAGCRALCLTVDTPVLGPRDREKREGFAMPADLRFGNLDALSAPYTADRHHDPRSIYNPFLNPGMTWETVDAIRSATRLPLVLKGILAAEDARLAVEHGAAAIAVSNHGGRNLDTVPASIEALPGVVEAVFVAVLLVVVLSAGASAASAVPKVPNATTHISKPFIRRFSSRNGLGYGPGACPPGGRDAARRRTGATR